MDGGVALVTVIDYEPFYLPVTREQPPALLAQFERQLAQHGRQSLERSRVSLQRRLAEHLLKLAEYSEFGGYTSSVEREIENFSRQIEAIDSILARP